MVLVFILGIILTLTILFILGSVKLASECDSKDLV